MFVGSEVADVRDLIMQYIGTLDSREFDAWLGLYRDNGYYEVLRGVEYEAGNNLVLVGEDMKRLRARVEAGAERDRRRTVHMVSWVRTKGEGSAGAAFTLWMDGVPAYAGQYRLQLDSTPRGMRIARCSVIIDTDMIRQPVFLPI